VGSREPRRGAADCGGVLGAPHTAPGLVERWHVDGCPVGLRLGISGPRRTPRVCSGLTPLAPQRDPLDPLCRASPWRGHVDGLVQAGRSSATLPAFATANPALVEGVMGVAMAAAARTRCVAHRPPLLAAVPRSTRQVARWAVPV